MMKRVLIVGGSNGIGLAMATSLASREGVERIYIVDKVPVDQRYLHPKFQKYFFNLDTDDYKFFDRFTDVDTVIVTAGIGSLKLFKDIDEEDIPRYFRVNAIPAMRLARKFYSRLQSQEDFSFCVMVSIAGFLSSPWYSVYGATKSALKSFIESVNVELKKDGSSNRILNVSPGHMDGTSFTGEPTIVENLLPLVEEIIRNMEEKNDLFIPKYEEIYKEVLRRYREDFRAEGERSYEYKKSRL